MNLQPVERMIEKISHRAVTVCFPAFHSSMDSCFWSITVFSFHGMRASDEVSPHRRVFTMLVVNCPLCLLWSVPLQ